MLFLSRLLALLAAASVVMPALGATADCTSRSLSIPSWIIQDFVLYGNNVRFKATNRAISATFLCEGATGGQQTCLGRDGIPDLGFSLNATTGFLSLRQKWECNDMRRFVSFSAIGNATLALHASPPVLIRASLLEPAEITPAAPPPAVLPFGHAHPGCTVRSRTPTWEAINVFPAWPCGRHSNITLSLRNMATFQLLHCMVVLPESVRPVIGDMWVGCEAEANTASDVLPYKTETLVHYDFALGEFRVKQTWYCDDEDPMKPTKFEALGIISFDDRLRCVPLGEWLPWNDTIRGTSTATALEPFALLDPAPVPSSASCTVKSFGDPHFLVTKLDITRNASAKTDTYTPETVLDLEFITAGKAVDRPSWRVAVFRDWQDLMAYEDNVLYRCGVGDQGWYRTTWDVPECGLNFDWENRQLRLEERWICVDKDPERQLHFLATGTKALKFAREDFFDTPLGKQIHFSLETSGNKASRVITPSDFNWQVPVTGWPMYPDPPEIGLRGRLNAPSEIA